jgi:hypothetical protein
MLRADRNMPGDRDQDKTGAKTRRGGWPRPLAATVGGLAKKTIGKRGFAEAGLITGWEDIVGPELAASCWPDRLTFTPGRRDGGTLRIRVAGGFALELQHMEPQLLERINRERNRLPPAGKPGKKRRSPPIRRPAPRSKMPWRRWTTRRYGPYLRALAAP